MAVKRKSNREAASAGRRDRTTTPAPAAVRNASPAVQPKADSSVKSAKRVFEVLEFFEEHQRAASTIEVANALKFPQSSTSVLMRTMTSLGYLRYDSSRRNYIPTARVSMLGNWLSPALFERGRLINLMEDLSNKTNETIMVGLQNGLTAQYIHVIQAKLPMRLYVKAGTLRPLGRSGLGYALLSNYKDQEVRRIVKLLNTYEADPTRHIDVKKLLVELANVRNKGHAFSLNLVTPGAGVVAMNLPKIVESQQPLVICVAGLTDALIRQEQDIANLMRRTIDFHLSD
jgi:DNA-binding IclR family transcriptional regulator